jgi:ABC-type oligopeptide transport system substrate-binding subunit
MFRMTQTTRSSAVRPTASRLRWPILVTVLALLFVACGGGNKSADKGSSAAGEPKRGGVFRLGIVEPTAIDPYNAQETEGLLVTKQLFTGLTTLDDASVELRPGVAEKWSRSDDCAEWTFNLRPSIRFTNGEEVTAASFIRGMTRAAKQSAASDVAYHMGGIEGYQELHGSGEAGAPSPRASQFSGLSAPDPHTLKVKLSAPDCEFDRKTLQPVMSPVPEVAGEATNRAYNDMPIGNGPFKMKEPWRHDERISLVRNDDYFGEKPSLDGVEITILPSQGALEAEYKGVQAGQFDYARVPPSFVPQAKAIYGPKGGFINKLTYSITYLLVNVVNPPLDSPEARKAVSLAIDRDAIIEGVWKGFQTKATSLVPPVFKAYYQPNVCDVCDKADPARAKALAASAGLLPGTKVNFAFNTGGGHEAWVQAVAQQLEKNLGLQIDLQPMPFAELLKREKASDASGLFRAGWIADYPSAENMLFPLLSKHSLPPGDNRGRYVNERFDDLLAQARKAPSEDQRANLIKEAERIAIGTDLALIPLWYRSVQRVFDADRWADMGLDFFENPTLAVIHRK